MSENHLLGVESARTTAHELGIALHIADLREQFKASVIIPFTDAYSTGRTPNPCVLCNPYVKFRSLADTAASLGAYSIASGHYARITDLNGYKVIEKASDKARDQSYMLYRLEQKILAKLILPLGLKSKTEVRALAGEAGLSSSLRPDSQEICFAPDGDYIEYMHSLSLYGKKGSFLSPDGENMGSHKGVEFYTVGQRRGLCLNTGRPVFVKRILENGDILLAYSGDEYARQVTVDRLSLNPAFDLGSENKLEVKLRSAAKPAKACISPNDDGTLELAFFEPQRAPAPGQSAVLYKGDLLVGGGFIVDFA